MVGTSTARTLTVKSAIYPKAGSLLTIQTSDGLVDLTAVTEVAHYVAMDESSRDAAGTLVAAAATVTGEPIGGVIHVLATAAEAWTAGDTLFVGALGLATSTAGSNKLLGVYLGAALTTAADTLYAVNTVGAEQV